MQRTYKNFMKLEWIPLSQKIYNKFKDELLSGKVSLEHWCELMRTLKFLRYIEFLGAKDELMAKQSWFVKIFLRDEGVSECQYWLDKMMIDYGTHHHFHSSYFKDFSSFFLLDHIYSLLDGTHTGFNINCEDGRNSAYCIKKRIERYDCENKNCEVKKGGTEEKISEKSPEVVARHPQDTAFDLLSFYVISTVKENRKNYDEWYAKNHGRDVD